MTSSLFSLSKRLRSFRLHDALITNGITSRFYSARVRFYKQIFPLANRNISVVKELEKRANEGKKAPIYELQQVLRELRKRREYAQALQLTEWMSSKGLVTLKSSSDHAKQLELIGRVNGMDAAESYFNSLDEDNKVEETYGALLSCYVRKQSTKKSLSHMQKMKELGFSNTAMTYNSLMTLFTNTGQLEKVPKVLAEMKEDGVLPDNFSYRICMNSYGARSDIIQVEKLLEEMESQPHISMDWNAYAVVANLYIKAGLTEKAMTALKKSEEKLEIKNNSGYSHLISLYGSLRNKTEMLRLWVNAKSSPNKFINRDYMNILGSLVKVGDFKTAETVLKEWFSSGNSYGGRVPRVLLRGYCQNGMVEKAEALIENMVKIGKSPSPECYEVVAAGYVHKGDLKKGVEFMKKALPLHAENKEGWEPNPEVIESLLGWFGDEGDVEGTEAFVDLVKTVVPMNRDMYHALIKASIRAGKHVDGLVERMKADNITENEETMKIFSLKTTE